MIRVRPLIVGVVCAIAIQAACSVTTNALNFSDFDPGRIIDDEVFYNKNDMSVDQIQTFLDAHVPSCDIWGTGVSGYGSLTNAQYAQQIKGWPGPPYVCLNKYYENPGTGATSFEKGGGWFEGGLSSAQIIYDAAQKYGINPKVLLITLRKESLNLYGDSWPLKSQYKYSMGYACPDSGPNYSANCDASKAGFFNQMMTAAWQFRYYYDHMGTYNFAPGRWNTIQYAPNPGCGTKDVYIQNYATASLYIYTPYVPNEGALAAYPGESYCGAYGNRNFWAFWREWFGSTYGHATATPLSVSQSDDSGHRFVGDQIQASYTVTNESVTNLAYNAIGIAGRDPNGGNIDPVWLNNYTLPARQSKIISGSINPTIEGGYQLFLSSWLKDDVGWRACQLNSTESTCFNPYTVQLKPSYKLAYKSGVIGNTTRKGNTIAVDYNVSNPSAQYTYGAGKASAIRWVNGGYEWSPVNLPDIKPSSVSSGVFTKNVPRDKELINFELRRGTVSGSTPNVSILPEITLTQGLTLSDNNPRANASVVGSFKLKNFSDHTVSTKDQLCYIIRDVATNGNHDFGCKAIGTLSPSQEVEFSQTGSFSRAGQYKAYFAIYNGTYWRPFDTYTPETGAENTSLQFTVKPAITMTQGITMTQELRGGNSLTGAFKLKNFSNQVYTTNDQLCYIIRDVATNGNHDLGCFQIGTIQPNQEVTYSRNGMLIAPGEYKAYFAILNGSTWRPFDTYTPETGAENTSLQFTVKPAIALAQGLSLSKQSPYSQEPVVGSFKLKNFSDHTVSTKDQLCYIIRDVATNGNHDFGCKAIGTLSPSQEVEFSQTGSFSRAGQYKAYFAIYSGTYWRPFDTYTPETGAENTSLQFTVKPAITMTQGITISPTSPVSGRQVVGSFKLANRSTSVASTNDQLCYIIRDVATNGNHDLGCFQIGTIQPNQEVTYSRNGMLIAPGEYKAYFAILNGSTWRPFDTYTPETGAENTSLQFTVVK